MKSVITVKCPDCKGTLEIDVSREVVLSHKPFIDSENPEKDKAELFDDVLKRVQNKERSSKGDAFDRAHDKYQEGQDRLEELFGDAKKKIQKQKDSGEDIEKNPRDLFWD